LRTDKKIPENTGNRWGGNGTGGQRNPRKWCGPEKTRSRKNLARRARGRKEMEEDNGALLQIERRGGDFVRKKRKTRGEEFDELGKKKVRGWRGKNARKGLPGGKKSRTKNGAKRNGQERLIGGGTQKFKKRWPTYRCLKGKKARGKKKRAMA